MRCAVLGDPVDHSLSPVLHRAAYDALGLGWSYDPVRVPSGELGAFLGGLGREWRGLSLTMPLKREVLPLLDDVSAVARLAGGANTVVLEGGRRLGDNTDVPGAVAALRERLPGPPRTAAVLGVGATAASTGIALVEMGCGSVDLLARRPETAEETRRLLAAHPAAPTVTVRPLGGSAGAAVDVLVSTIPAAAQTDELLGGCPEAGTVFEVVYDPWPTPLAVAARSSGRPLVTGLDLLVQQAALQVGLFTGRPGPVDVMRAAGEAALGQRGRA